MTRFPPRGYASCESWAAFNIWADAHHVPGDSLSGGTRHQWESWWECFLAGYTKGILDADNEADEGAIKL